MSLEKKKKEVELKRIDANIADLEYKIQERMEDIGRMEAHIQLQKERMKIVTKEIEEGNK